MRDLQRVNSHCAFFCPALERETDDTRWRFLWSLETWEANAIPFHLHGLSLPLHSFVPIHYTSPLTKFRHPFTRVASFVLIALPFLRADTNPIDHLSIPFRAVDVDLSFFVDDTTVFHPVSLGLCEVVSLIDEIIK